MDDWDGGLEKLAGLLKERPFDSKAGLTRMIPSLNAARRGMAYPNLERNIVSNEGLSECRKYLQVKE